jgi:hypothetical protein
MLLKLYPRVHRRYTSLPILGPILDGFGAWLLNQGYATDCVREHFCTARRLTRIFELRGIHSLAKLTRARLRACAPANRLDDHRLYATVRLLERYIESETSLFPPRVMVRRRGSWFPRVARSSAFSTCRWARAATRSRRSIAKVTFFGCSQTLGVGTVRVPGTLLARRSLTTASHAFS